jgi:uncharacterized membrane protein YciS (DUF1049 family)
MDKKDTYKVGAPLPGTGAGRKFPSVDVTDPGAGEKHEESLKKYPELSLSKNEYVIAVVRRHPIGLFFIWGFVALLMAIVFAFLTWYASNSGIITGLFLISGDVPSATDLMPLALIFIAFFALGGLIATFIYVDNRFYLTNESVFQFLRTGILAQQMQVINLINVEDTSKEQNGILQNIFNYGTLRLSTQGQETTYHFYYVHNPGKLVSIINDASERAVRRLEGFPAGEF